MLCQGIPTGGIPTGVYSRGIPKRVFPRGIPRGVYSRGHSHGGHIHEDIVIGAYPGRYMQGGIATVYNHGAYPLRAYLTRGHTPLGAYLTGLTHGVHARDNPTGEIEPMGLLS